MRTSFSGSTPGNLSAHCWRLARRWGFIFVCARLSVPSRWAWIKSEILTPKRLVFKSDCLYYQAVQLAIAEGCKHKRRAKKRTDKTGKAQNGKSKPKRRKRMKKNKMIAENVTTPEARP